MCQGDLNPRLFDITMLLISVSSIVRLLKWIRKHMVKQVLRSQPQATLVKITMEAIFDYWGKMKISEVDPWVTLG